MPRTVLRLRAVQLGFAVAIAVLVMRAAQVQLLHGERYKAVAGSQRTDSVLLPGPRGALYDRNRVPLGLTAQTFHVGVAVAELPDTRAGVAAISQHLDLSRDYVEQMFRRDYAYFHGPFTLRQVRPLRSVGGIDLTSELTRFYPNPDFARAVLGRPAAPGRPASGIERVLDTLLTGRPGRAVVLRDQFGRQYQSPSRLDAFPVAGHDVYLTLDAELQDIVEQSLAEAIDRLDAAGGDVVVMNPKTGELLAVAALRADGSAPPSVFTSVFEPGSTAKLFAAAGLLRNALVRPTDSVWGENGRYVVGSRTIEDEHQEQWMTLHDVIQRSSNIGIAKFVARMSREQQFETLRDFGLGTPTGVEFPVESPGILSHPTEWSGTSAASISFGYEVAVTMLQLAAAYASIANDGILMQPALVLSVRDPMGNEVYRHRPRPVRRVLDADVARELRDMLRGAVQDQGTGSTAALVNYQLAGKTGTARRAGVGGYIPGSSIASFASIFPADDPQLVMVVKLDDPAGTYATATAAPLTRSVLEQILAAPTTAIDPSRLTGAFTSKRPVESVDEHMVPIIVPWPARVSENSEEQRVVPQGVGLSLRRVALRLHRVDLRVRVIGRGMVDSLVPGPGTAMFAGDLVTVFATPANRYK